MKLTNELLFFGTAQRPPLIT